VDCSTPLLLFPALSHPASLVFPAVTADAAAHVCGIRTMLEVVPALKTALRRELHVAIPTSKSLEKTGLVPFSGW
jgi:hypothetical protein